MIRGAIFDMDGVVLDSMAIWHDLGARYLRMQQLCSEEGLNEKLFSMSMEQGAAYLKAHYPLPYGEEEIVRQLSHMVETFYRKEVQAKDGIRELLETLRHRSVPMVAATSSPRGHIEAALRRLGLLDYFRRIYTTSEVGTSKHSPEIYRLCAAYLGTERAETLVFEDSLYALQTAAEDGFPTVGVCDPQGEANQQGLQQRADYYLKNISEYSVISLD